MTSARLTCIALLLLTACVRQVPHAAAPAQTLRLLAATDERQSDSILERRVDLEFDVRDFERSPHLVTTGETPLFSIDDAEVRLFGNAEGTAGFSVDNCIFLEVLTPEGTVFSKSMIGFADGLLQGKNVIDSLGRRAFSFEPGEVSLATVLPERGQVKLRASVLDYGGVAKNSDVFVLVRPRATPRDDLQNQ